jgi:hypothetical protein
VWSFANAHFDAPREAFETSVRHKSKVILYRERGRGALLGFMAVSLPRTRVGGRAISVIGTHHVALEPAVRGKNLLQHTCLALWWRLAAARPLAQVWWHFDTFSYKSYLAMTRTFATYWPRHDRPTPAPILELMDHLQREAGALGWDRERGVIRGRGWALRSRVADVEPALLADPDVRFFVERNPDHALGDSLVCLCPITFANLASGVVKRHLAR